MPPERQVADDVALAEQVAAAQKVYLFAEFSDVMGRLGRKYGILAVQQQARDWCDYIDHVRARNDGRIDGHE